MLAKKYRLPIQTVIGKNGQSFRGRYFLLKIFPNSMPHNRFGIIISKKLAVKATRRNSLKRAIFHVLENYIFSGKEKKDFLIIVSSGVKELDKEGVNKQLREFFDKLYIEADYRGSKRG